MNSFELKYLLKKIYQQKGSDSLSEVECLFANNKIDYQTYLHYCYLDTLNCKLLKSRPRNKKK